MWKWQRNKWDEKYIFKLKLTIGKWNFKLHEPDFSICIYRDMFFSCIMECIYLFFIPHKVGKWDSPNQQSINEASKLNWKLNWSYLLFSLSISQFIFGCGAIFLSIINNLQSVPTLGIKNPLQKKTILVKYTTIMMAQQLCDI